MKNKRINIFVGHYGSGKSEISVNYAFKLAKEGLNVKIVDLDIINPFFRSSDAKNILKLNGIELIQSIYANTNVEAPAVPAEVNTVIENKSITSVLDIGGDDLGAKALARYEGEIQEDEYDMFFVINKRRPLTSTVECIIKYIKEIEEASKFKITGLINNTNVLEYTTIEDILDGENLLIEVSQKINIPIAFSTCMENNYEELKDKAKYDILKLEKYIKLPWNKEI